MKRLMEAVELLEDSGGRGYPFDASGRDLQREEKLIRNAMPEAAEFVCRRRSALPAAEIGGAAIDAIGRGTSMMLAVEVVAGDNGAQGTATVAPISWNKAAEKRLRNAAAGDNTAAIHEALRDGAYLDAADGHGKTALHCAAEAGAVSAVKELLQGSADPNAGGENSGTPLDAALHWILKERERTAR